MKRTTKRGFTIVELVIVIAVIAILAAVLIPTFSNLVAKANLSSDMQAVREMNIALANAEATDGKPATIEAAMKVIADAGYDVDAWNPISKGYEVYWHKGDNCCILYNSAEAKVEYPEDYEGKSFATDIDFASQVYVYNQTFKKAQQVDFTYKSESTVTVGGKDYKGSVINSDDTNTSKAYATVVVKNADAAAKQEYTVLVQTKEGATAEEIKTAQQAAGTYVYSLFTQMDLNQVSKDSTINFAPDTVIDISHLEWNPVELFTGHFGSTDPDHPVVIKGLKLTDATGYEATYKFRGTGSLYYCSGFFGAIYGDCTIENVVFEDVTIETPANDCILMSEKANSNTTAIIGGIVRNPETDGETNVVIRNVKCENVKVTGAARTGGLVGFVGGYAVNKGKDDKGKDINEIYGLKGSVTIDNCSFDGEVESLLTSSSYGTAGAIIGFVNKFEENKDFTITISNTTISGKVKGYDVGGVTGCVMAYEGNQIILDNVTMNAELTKTSADTNSTTGLIADHHTNHLSTYVVKSFTAGETTYNAENPIPDAKRAELFGNSSASYLKPEALVITYGEAKSAD